jgi:hypothetical protein
MLTILCAVLYLYAFNFGYLFLFEISMKNIQRMKLRLALQQARVTNDDSNNHYDETVISYVTSNRQTVARV